MRHQNTLDDIKLIFVKRSPICIDISPIAQVALLQTEINSGFRFVPSTGIKSAAGGKARGLITRHWPWLCLVYAALDERTNAWFDMLETSLSQITQQGKRALPHFWHFVLNNQNCYQTLNIYKWHCPFDQNRSVSNISSPACTGTWGWGCCYKQPAARWCLPNLQLVHSGGPKPRSWNLCPETRTGLVVTDKATNVKYRIN